MATKRHRLLVTSGKNVLLTAAASSRLARFGQVFDGKKALGMFLNAILDTLGEREDVAFSDSLSALTRSKNLLDRSKRESAIADRSDHD